MNYEVALQVVFRCVVVNLGVLQGGVEEEQQCLLQSRIGDLILPNIPDRWVWSLEASGEFSVKYVRSLIDDSLLPKEDVVTRWVNVMPIKINVFAWSPFG
ncbi:hypothetical protein Tco_0246374 [Tanacetum coccineum]